MKATIMLLAVASAALSAGGCSSSPTSAYGCPVPLLPDVVLLYPVPGTTGVPDAPGVLIYETTFGPAVPIELQGGASTIHAKATATPSPLPSPASSPVPGIDIGIYAAALPALRSHTTYFVSATLQSCGATELPMGGFTTK